MIDGPPSSDSDQEGSVTDPPVREDTPNGVTAEVSAPPPLEAPRADRAAVALDALSELVDGPVRGDAPAEQGTAAPGTDREPQRPRSSKKGPAGAPKRRRKRKGLRGRMHPRWGRSSAHLLSNFPLVTGMVLLGIFVLIGLFAPLAYPGDPNALPVDENVFTQCEMSSAPTLQLFPFSLGPHPLGQTAHLGFDVAQGLMLGTRWDLLFIAIVVGLSVLVGAVLGATAGAMGGWAESALSPLFDGALSFPPFLVVLVVLAVVTPEAPPGTTLAVFLAGVSAVLWAPFAQAVRAQAHILGRQPFVEAARASGARWPRVVLRHILPNCNAAILAQIPPTVFSLLFVMGAYQYLGLLSGNNPACGHDSQAAGAFLLLPSYQFPEWTWVLANGTMGWFPPGVGTDQWWGYLLPVGWIVLFLLALTLFCDGLLAYLSPFERH